MWTYISLGYFRQRLSAQGSTGSSTMPHKVNPIRFENGEANLEISCALLETLAATLVTSRLQRDLTDSTTQRNAGVALGHSLLAIDNIRRGLAGLDVDRARLEADLDTAWEVLGEPVQQAMRAAAVAGARGMADPYERLKELTRGKRVTPEAPPTPWTCLDRIRPGRVAGGRYPVQLGLVFPDLRERGRLRPGGQRRRRPGGRR